VTWRTSDALVGWAPLGPSGPQPFGPDTWCFVAAKTFTSWDAHRFDVRADDVRRAVALTAPTSGAGPPPGAVAAARGRPIVPLPMTRLPSLGRTAPPPPPSTTATALR
jgi:hypothetical protein